MSIKPTINTEAQVLTRDHPFATDERFLVGLSEGLARLHHTATNADRVNALNRATASHIKQLDADALAKARAEGAVNERKRIQQIITSIQAWGREHAAQSLAFQSDNPAVRAHSAALDRQRVGCRHQDARRPSFH